MVMVIMVTVVLLLPLTISVRTAGCFVGPVD